MEHAGLVCRKTNAATKSADGELQMANVLDGRSVSELCSERIYAPCVVGAVVYSGTNETEVVERRKREREAVGCRAARRTADW